MPTGMYLVGNASGCRPALSLFSPLTVCVWKQGMLKCLSQTFCQCLVGVQGWPSATTGMTRLSNQSCRTRSFLGKEKKDRLLSGPATEEHVNTTHLSGIFVKMLDTQQLHFTSKLTSQKQVVRFTSKENSSKMTYEL